MTRCKPGDLAKVLWARHKEHIGETVVVVSLCPVASRDFGTPTWNIEPLVRDGTPTPLGGWVSMDSSLKPIDPGEGNESFFKAAPQPQSRAAELLS